MCHPYTRMQPDAQLHDLLRFLTGLGNRPPLAHWRGRRSAYAVRGFGGLLDCQLAVLRMNGLGMVDYETSK